MSQQSFDLTRISVADRILGVGALLFVIDSFLPWQSVCVKNIIVSVCVTASLWGGTAAIVGTLAGVCAILLLVFVVGSALGFELGSMANAGIVLAGATSVLALIKWLSVIGKDIGLGGWLGLILLLVIAAGAVMKLQSSGGLAAPPAAPGGPPPPPA